MKTLMKIGVIIIVMLSLSAAVFAGGSKEESFLDKLEARLPDHGFTEEEIAEIMDSAEALDWSGAGNSNVGVVARSLAELKEENTGLDGEEQARIAHSFEYELRTMEGEGMSENEVSQTALRAVEELREQIRAWQSEGKEEQLGELVRNTVRERVKEAVKEKTRTKKQGGENSGNSGNDTSEDSGDNESPASESERGLDKASEKASPGKK